MCEKRGCAIGLMLLGVVLAGGCGRGQAGAGSGERRSAAIAASSANSTANGEISHTFSIVAADPETGVCGAAVASMYPAVGSVVPAVRGGVGAFCTQHMHQPQWRARAIGLLGEGKSPTDVLAAPWPATSAAACGSWRSLMRMAARRVNPDRGRGGESLVGSDERPVLCLPREHALRTRSRHVDGAADEQTPGSLADRLMAALVAGDCAGGDHRGRLAAGIIVARPGSDDAWLELYIDKSDDAVLERRKYVEIEHDAKGRGPRTSCRGSHPAPIGRRPSRRKTDPTKQGAMRWNWA